MTVTEVLDNLFKKLNHDLIGENYLIYLEAQNDLEEVIKGEVNNSTDDEIRELESQLGDLENENDELRDSCNCECVKCKKCVDK